MWLAYIGGGGGAYSRRFTVYHKQIISCRCLFSFSINLLVGYHISCLLIGYATSRLLVIAY